MSDPRGEFEAVIEQLIAASEPTFLQFFDYYPEELEELLDTGSVTVKMLGAEYVLTLNIQKSA